MLATIAALIGFFGTALIGFALITTPNHPRSIAIVGTALVVVAFVLLLLAALGVTK
jgi:hypothetical protein